MGCASSEFVPSDCAEADDALMEANEEVIKAITCKFCHERRFGVAVKLLNISRLIKGYYSHLRSQRSAALSRLRDLPEEATIQVHAQLAKERRELTEANDVPVREYRRLAKMNFLSSVYTDVQKWAAAVTADPLLALAVHNIKKKYREAMHSKRSLDDLVLEVNSNEPLTEAEHAVIKKIATVTTYKFTSKVKPLQYSVPNSQRLSRPVSLQLSLRRAPTFRQRIHQRSKTSSLII